MGKSTISMAIFNSYVKLPEGIPHHIAAYSLGLIDMAQFLFSIAT